LLAVAALVAATSASAIPRTWVSSTGGGAACTRAAPCATFQAAHDATDANGEINCVDSGVFGGVIITKSITIDCAGTAATADAQITIMTTGLTVRLRNLIIDGDPNAGVYFNSNVALFIERCTIANSPAGIFYSPLLGGAARMFVSDTTIANTTTTAMRVLSNAALTHATIDRTRMQNGGGDGLLVQGLNTDVHVRNSVITGYDYGLALLGGSVYRATVDRSSITHNAAAGVFAEPDGPEVILGRSTVLSNTRGLEAHFAKIISYQNNHLTGNVVDGAPTNVLSLR
jgi:hypothetical protein